MQVVASGWLTQAGEELSGLWAGLPAVGSPPLAMRIGGAAVRPAIVTSPNGVSSAAELPDAVVAVSQGRCISWGEIRLGWGSSGVVTRWVVGILWVGIRIRRSRYSSCATIYSMVHRIPSVIPSPHTPLASPTER